MPFEIRRMLRSAVPTPVGVNRLRIPAALIAIVAVPTPVGVNRQNPNIGGSHARRPHARGGEPPAHRTRLFNPPPSPRPWG